MAHKKIVFIAHPVRGDIEGNVKKVLAICASAHKQGVIPIAPYLVSLQYLDDAAVEDRELGIEVNHVCIRRFVDEVWLYGDRISSGMRGEVELALRCGVPVVAKTEGTARDLGAF